MSYNVTFFCFSSPTQRREALRCSLPNLNSSARPSCKSIWEQTRSWSTALYCSTVEERKKHSLQLFWFSHVTVFLFLAIHKTQPWFHGGVSRKEAQRLIEKQGLVDGWVVQLHLQLFHTVSIRFCTSRLTWNATTFKALINVCVCVCVYRMFLIRDSRLHAQCFVLSLCYQLQTKHYLVIPVSSPCFLKVDFQE